MAEAGRPRLPTAIKEAQGTLEKSRVKDEPKWAEGAPEPPSWLMAGETIATEHALTEWARLVPLLIEQGLFPASAHSLVAGSCQQWGIWRESEEKIAVQGRVIYAGKDNYPMPNPWVAIGKSAWAGYLTACGRFGLDPASAGKVTARPKSTNEDELAKVREQRRAAR